MTHDHFFLQHIEAHQLEFDMFLYKAVNAITKMAYSTQTNTHTHRKEVETTVVVFGADVLSLLQPIILHSYKLYMLGWLQLQPCSPVKWLLQGWLYFCK